MATLLSLPDELLLKITQEIKLSLIAEYGEARPSEFLALARTCKRLNPIANESLYHTIEVWDSAPGRMAQAIRTLMERPDLASIVQKVDMGFERYNNEGEELIRKKEDLSNIYSVNDNATQEDNEHIFATKCFRFIEPLQATYSLEDADPLSPTSAWKRDIEHTLIPALGGLLLTLVPNMKSLQLHYTAYLMRDDSNRELGVYEPFVPWFQDMFGVCREQLPACVPFLSKAFGSQNLESLDINGTSMELLSLPLPALKNLTIDFSIPVQNKGLEVLRDAIAWNPVGPERLETLQISASNHELNELSNLDRCFPQLIHILGCSNLNTFCFELRHCQPDREVRGRRFVGHYNVLVRSLAKTAVSLKALEITFDTETISPLYLRCLSPQASTGLTQFINLRQLTIYHNALIHYDYGKKHHSKRLITNVLPISLKVLTIQAPRSTIVLWLEDFYLVRSAYPLLKSITFDFYGDFGVTVGELKTMASSVIEKFTDSGIEFFYLYRPSESSPTMTSAAKNSVWEAAWGEEDWSGGLFAIEDNVGGDIP